MGGREQGERQQKGEEELFHCAMVRAAVRRRGMYRRAAGPGYLVGESEGNGKGYFSEKGWLGAANAGGLHVHGSLIV